MKRVTVKNLQGIQTHGAEMEDPTQWIADCVTNGYWGRPARWVKEADLTEEDLANSTGESREVEGLDFDENGEIEMLTEVLVAADYTVEVKDVSAQKDAAAILAKRIAEYPTPEEFMNAYFDGGANALDELRNRRFEVKHKFPKAYQ